MKLVIAQMKHETNTYSPVPTPLARFAVGGGAPPEGDAARAAYAGTGSAIAAFIELADAAGAEVAIPIAASAWPSGPVEDAAFEHIAGRICDAVAAGCDGVLLDLHGAMVTQSHEDGEGELLRRIRAIAADVPIGVALDMHTNLYDGFARDATVIAGYQTYPHVDHARDGAARRPRAARAARGQGATDDGLGPSRHAAACHAPGHRRLAESAAAGALPRDGDNKARSARACSSASPTPTSNLPGCRQSSSPTATPPLAATWRDELLDLAWKSRAEFVYTVEPLAESIARARAIADAAPPGSGPVVLLDHSDNCASGGTMDTMTVLGAILDAGLDDVAAFAVYDPAAVQEMIAAGIGADVTLSLGGKLDMPAIGLAGEPRTVSGRVRLICDGRYRNRGPMARGEMNDMGPTALLDTGKVQIVVISNHVEPHDLAAFTAVGIAPEVKRFVMLKSRIHWRAGLSHLAHAVVECAGSGVCTSDYAALNFKKVRRPIYPLDGVTSAA